MMAMLVSIRNELTFPRSLFRGESQSWGNSHRFSFKTCLRRDFWGIVQIFCQNVACVEFSIALEKLKTIQLKARRFIMLHTIRSSSGCETFEGHFELRILYFVDTEIQPEIS